MCSPFIHAATHPSSLSSLLTTTEAPGRGNVSSATRLEGQRSRLLSLSLYVRTRFVSLCFSIFIEKLKTDQEKKTWHLWIVDWMKFFSETYIMVWFYRTPPQSKSFQSSLTCVWTCLPFLSPAWVDFSTDPPAYLFSLDRHWYWFRVFTELAHSGTLWLHSNGTESLYVRLKPISSQTIPVNSIFHTVNYRAF